MNDRNRVLAASTMGYAEPFAKVIQMLTHRPLCRDAGGHQSCDCGALIHWMTTIKRLYVNGECSSKCHIRITFAQSLSSKPRGPQPKQNDLWGGND